MTINTAFEQDNTRGRFITTYSGVKFFVDECNVQDVPMEDIAHALAMNCRFNGHLKVFYSVGEHSVLVSKLVPEEFALWGLLHDITEAFVPDVPRPFKSLIHGFEEFEDKLAEKVSEHFEMPWPMPAEVKYVDTHIVADEARKLCLQPPDWIKHYDTVCPPELIIGLTPAAAKGAFLERFYELTK